MGTKSAIVYWGDLKERDERAQGMRVRYELNDFRRALVQEAFYKLDQDGDGVVVIEDLRRGGYDFRTHPRWTAEGAVNKWTEDEIYRSVLSKFKGLDHVYEPRMGLTEKFDRLVPADLERYYEKVGASIDDEYFEAMIVQAWRLPGHAGPQGANAEVLGRLALIEANMMNDAYLGQESLNQQKLAAIEVSEEHGKGIARWAGMVRSGDFREMAKAGEEMARWVVEEESHKAFPHKLPANAVRLFKKGGADVLAQLAGAQDGALKRLAANILHDALQHVLPRLALAGDANGRARLVREGLPALCQAPEVVTRNKGEKVKALLAAGAT
ncbi:hypothetical protein T484DRAFT_1749393 [Baffinella frigidus]|nr:hypothetical protein T484DRAFT_1749393 [Cryptophyta sp. CCMP2293]